MIGYKHSRFHDYPRENGVLPISQKPVRNYLYGYGHNTDRS